MTPSSLAVVGPNNVYFFGVEIYTFLRLPVPEFYCTRFGRFHGIDYKDYCILGYNAAQSGRKVLRFRRNLVPPSSAFTYI
jgi:hypothetical protein